MGIATLRAWLGLAAATVSLAAMGTVALPGATSPSSAASAPDCGPTIMKANGSAWTCTFSDDFTGLTLDGSTRSVLTTAKTGMKTQDCRTDDPSNVRVRNGHLRLTALELRRPMECSMGTSTYTTNYTSGAVSSGQRFSQAFGRFEIRAAFPEIKLKGLHSALWLWPQASKYVRRLAGEIDLAEFRTGFPDRVVPTLHYLSDTSSLVTNWNCPVTAPEQWHTYALEWTRTAMTFLYDGAVCWRTHWQPAEPLAAPSPFDEPFFLVMNQSLGKGLNAFDPLVTPLPASMYVDYVHVWQ